MSIGSSSPSELTIIVASTASRAFGRATVTVVQSLFVLMVWAALLFTGALMLFGRLVGLVRERVQRARAPRGHVQIHS